MTVNTFDQRALVERLFEWEPERALTFGGNYFTGGFYREGQVNNFPRYWCPHCKTFTNFFENWKEVQVALAKDSLYLLKVKTELDRVTQKADHKIDFQCLGCKAYLRLLVNHIEFSVSRYQVEPVMLIEWREV